MPSTYDIGDVVRTWGRFSTSTSSTDYQDPSRVNYLYDTPSETRSTDFLDPPGTTSSTLIKRSSTGEFYVDILTTEDGLYEYRWTSTGTLQTSEEGRFLVRDRRVV